MFVASPPQVTYRCPGESYDISRAVHLARLAAFYSKCRDCPHRHDTARSEAPADAPAAEAEPPPPRSGLFRAEGVRGRYLNELSRYGAAEIAGAFASHLWDAAPWPKLPASAPSAVESASVPALEGITLLPRGRPGPTVVLAHDDRPASPDIVIGVGLALRRMGCQVIDIGLATRPCFWFAIDHLQAAGGVHVTGSGCDPGMTGLDFACRGVFPSSQGGTLDVVAAKFEQGYPRPSRSAGSQRSFRAAVPYEAGLWKHFHALRPLSIAFACPSRPARDLFERLFRKLACRLLPVETPTRARDLGNPHDPDLARTSQAVSDNGAHLGVLVDDDAQACALFDEQGVLLSPSAVANVLAKRAIEENPGQAVVLPPFDVRCSTFDVRRSGGNVSGASGIIVNTCAKNDLRVRPETGHVQGADAPRSPTLEHIAREMEAQNAVFGASRPGHYWFVEPFPTCDAVLTVVKVLQALSVSDAPFSEVARIICNTGPA